jgi:glycosyltransferase involved in cell wall biosynthesis
MEGSAIKVSLIIPVYNGEPYIKRCFDLLIKQNFNETWEIIIVDDASTDDSKEIINKYKLPNLKLYSLPINSGQSAARNLGIKKSLGEYIFFQDIDDLICVESLKTLYEAAKKNNYDMVCSDFKRVENLENQREGTYNYTSDTIFNYVQITESMFRELQDPSLGHLGLFGCNGRLIRRSIVYDNKIFFEEKLRLLEDKIFGWNILSFCKKVIYIRKQLYSYYVNPNINTAITDSLNYGFTFETIKLILRHISNCLERRNLPKNEVEKHCQQGLIFFSIHALITISRPMFLGKIDFNKAKKIRRNIINQILKDNDISKAIKNYKISNKESSLIPKAIAWKSRLLLEFACDRRAKETIKMRRRGAV